MNIEEQLAGFVGTLQPRDVPTDAQRIVRLERLAPQQHFEFLQVVGQTTELPDVRRWLKLFIAAPGAADD